MRSTLLGGQVVSELNSSGQWARGYVYLGGQMVAIQQNSAVSWVHQDPVTKSQRVTNSSGTVTSTIDLDPWGGETSSSSNQAFQPHRFTTYERDANGGDEAMMRRYAGSWMRFSQPDPYDGSYNLGNPQSFNRYAYVQNDPVNFFDPSGLDPQDPQDPRNPPTTTHTDPADGTRVDVPGVNAGVVTITPEGSGPIVGVGGILGEGDTGMRVVNPPEDQPPGGGGPLGTESDLERRRREYRDKFGKILDAQYECFDRAGREKERQFNERIGPNATERLKKVYGGVLPGLDSLGPGGLGAVAKLLARQGLKGVAGGFAAGVGFGVVYKVWRNSLPLFAEWAKIDKDWLAARINCTSETSRRVRELGPAPK